MRGKASWSPGNKKRIKRALSAAEALALFLEARNAAAQGRLNALWEHWAMVLGPELAGLAVPLGGKGGELLLGAEDNAAAQEIHLSSREILERVNAFMDEEHFSRIRVGLSQGRRSLAEPRPRPPGPVVEPLRTMPPRPEGLGGLALDPADPVGRAYAAYVRAFARG